MGTALLAIPLGSYHEYELSLQPVPGYPPVLVADCAEPTRRRVYSPKLLGLAMVATNAAIGEAYRRAVERGHGNLLAA